MREGLSNLSVSESSVNTSVNESIVELPSDAGPTASTLPVERKKRKRKKGSVVDASASTSVDGSISTSTANQAGSSRSNQPMITVTGSRAVLQNALSNAVMQNALSRAAQSTGTLPAGAVLQNVLLQNARSSAIVGSAMYNALCRVNQSAITLTAPGRSALQNDVGRAMAGAVLQNALSRANYPQTMPSIYPQVPYSPVPLFIPAPVTQPVVLYPTPVIFLPSQNQGN